MTAKIPLQPQVVALATFRGPDGKDVQVYITVEWHRVLSQMVSQINDLQARVTALGG